MAIDVLCPNGIAVDVREAVGDIVLSGKPELIGRLVQVLVDKEILTAADLRVILPHSYEIRE